MSLDERGTVDIYSVAVVEGLFVEFFLCICVCEEDKIDFEFEVGSQPLQYHEQGEPSRMPSHFAQAGNPVTENP